MDGFYAWYIIYVYHIPLETVLEKVLEGWKRLSDGKVRGPGLTWQQGYMVNAQMSPLYNCCKHKSISEVTLCFSAKNRNRKCLLMICICIGYHLQFAKWLFNIIWIPRMLFWSSSLWFESAKQDLHVSENQFSCKQNRSRQFWVIDSHILNLSVSER